MIRDTSAQDQPVTTTASHRMKRWLRIAAIVGVILGIGGLGLGAKNWLLGERSVNASRIRVATVRRGTLVRDIVADGRVTAANSPTLYATASGTVDLKVAAGDTVVIGQAVATVESPELQSRLAQERVTRDQLKAELGRFRLRVEQASAQAGSLVDQAKIDRQTAHRELEQSKESYAQGVIPKITMLRAKDALAKANVALAHARVNLDLEKKGLEFERRSTALNLDRQKEVVRELERQIDALTVKSPVAGVVGQVVVRQRGKVSTQNPILTIVDLSALEVEIQIPESFARELAIGMPTEIDVRGTPAEARVRSVSPQVVKGEVAARIEFVGTTPEGLRQNQRLSARIVIDEKPNVLLVTRGPSIVANGRTAYFVDGQLAERRPIRIGAAGLREVEIISGAQEGDRLVVSGTDTFKEAARIRIAGDLP